MTSKQNSISDKDKGTLLNIHSSRDIEEAEKEALTLIEKSALQRAYEHPLIVGLANFLPGVGPAIHTGTVAQAQAMYERNVRCFFNQLSNGTTPLTPKLIENQDFLHAYFSTFSAAVRSRQEEKIRLFARLLRQYAESEQVAIEANTKKEGSNPADEFEENLRILDDLSYREFKILCILWRYEKTHPIENGSFQSRNFAFWHSFCGELWNLGIKDINGTMARLTRTGLYQIFSLRTSEDSQVRIRGSIDNPEDLSQCGMLTWLFGHFVRSLGIESEEDFRNVTKGKQ